MSAVSPAGSSPPLLQAKSANDGSRIGLSLGTLRTILDGTGTSYGSLRLVSSEATATRENELERQPP